MEQLLNRTNDVVEPNVSNELIDWLDKTFNLTNFRSAETLDALNRLQGQQEVIDHLKSLNAHQNREHNTT